MEKNKIFLLILTSSLILTGCGTIHISYEPSKTGDSMAQNETVDFQNMEVASKVSTTGDILDAFYEEIATLENSFTIMPVDGLNSTDVTGTINRKITQAKKTYDVCNISGCTMTTTYQTDGTTTVDVQVRYYMSKEQYDYVDKRVTRLSENMVGIDDYETHYNIYTWICSHVEYDNETVIGDADRFSAYDALKEGKAVCYGYAALYQKFCDILGLECMVMTSLDDTAHAWNVVKINDEYYHIDCTFGTTTTGIDYNYFLCGKDKISYGTSYGVDLAPKSYQIKKSD